jgi:YD repeat-containing protein
MSRRSLPNGVTTDWSFDDAGFLISLVSKKSGVTFDSHLYTPDPAGHILQENKNGTLDAFGYDELYRLTSATVSGTSYRWSYDNNGNRLTQDKGLDHTDYTCDQCDCLLSVNGAAVTSDANGSAIGFGSDVYTGDVRNRQHAAEPGGRPAPGTQRAVLCSERPGLHDQADGRSGHGRPEV